MFVYCCIHQIHFIEVLHPYIGYILPDQPQNRSLFKSRIMNFKIITRSALPHGLTKKLYGNLLQL
uniref:Uncharacterized protein n=1 Tax=Anguilla anguilla TaxID=7936 RepID=A0A0E9U0U8_ANGAN